MNIIDNENDFIIYNDKRYDYFLLEEELFDQYDLNCAECCFDSCRDESGYHTCPSKDKTFDWSCSRYIPGFQILLKKSE